MFNFELFNFMATIIPIMVLIIFTLTVLSIINPKLRGKILSRNIKAVRYAIDEAENDLKTINNKSANAESEAITIKAKAFKKGFENEIYCKHCGYLIDSDSIFCKKCGEKQ